MRRRIDPSRQPAHHPHAGIGQLVSQFFGQFDPVPRRLPRSDDSDTCPAHRFQTAPVIKHQRGIMNFPEERRIQRILAIHHLQFELGDLF